MYGPVDWWACHEWRDVTRERATRPDPCVLLAAQHATMIPSRKSDLCFLHSDELSPSSRLSHHSHSRLQALPHCTAQSALPYQPIGCDVVVSVCTGQSNRRADRSWGRRGKRDRAFGPLITDIEAIAGTKNFLHFSEYIRVHAMYMRLG